MTFEEALVHLKDMGVVDNKDGGLYSLGWYLAWTPGDDSATLDGKFHATDLIAIATYMNELTTADTEDEAQDEDNWSDGTMADGIRRGLRARREP